MRNFLCPLLLAAHFRQKTVIFKYIQTKHHPLTLASHQVRHLSFLDENFCFLSSLAKLSSLPTTDF